jgi:homoserine acetyltransferase
MWLFLETGLIYGHEILLFQVTIRDSVRLQILMAKDGIGAKKVASVIGGSMGEYI